MTEQGLVGLIFSWIVSTGLGALLSLPVMLYRIKRLEKADEDIWRHFDQIEADNRQEHRGFRTVNEHSECKASVCSKVDSISKRLDDFRITGR